MSSAQPAEIADQPSPLPPRLAERAPSGLQAPSATALAGAAEAALAALPPALADRFGSVAVSVEELPAPERLARLGVSDPYDLLGQFETDAGAGESTDPMAEPARLVLFRRPVLDYWAEAGAPLGELLAELLLAEIERTLSASAKPAV